MISYAADLPGVLQLSGSVSSFGVHVLQALQDTEYARRF
jgi:hypothetical protein